MKFFITLHFGDPFLDGVLDSFMDLSIKLWFIYPIFTLNSLILISIHGIHYKLYLVMVVKLKINN